MADKLAGGYRYIKKDGDKVSRVILQAGDDVPKDLSKEEVQNLKKSGLIVDEKRLSPEGLRLPYGHPDAEAKEETSAISKLSAEELRALAAEAEKAEAEAEKAKDKTPAKKQTAASGGSSS